jgi:hypothetical protein
MPGRRHRRQVNAASERRRDDGERADEAGPYAGLAPGRSASVSRGDSRWHFGSDNANEFVSASAEFNEFFMTIRILTTSKPETSLI